MRTVAYASTRREIWRAYWRAWARPAGLWRMHAVIGLVFAVSRVGPTGLGEGSLTRFLTDFAGATLLCVLVLPLYPQLRFKPQKRTLTVDETGYRTQIGKRSGARTWEEVAAVEEDRDAIVLANRNGNLMIVPRRAFATDAERRAFLTDAQRWHAAAATRPP
jgi:hypothetical protein